MSKAILLKAILFSGIAGFACQTQANLITNGSFESGLTGWSHNDVDLVNYWAASDGSYSIDMSGSEIAG